MTQLRGSSYIDDPAWLFTLKVSARRRGERQIVLRAFALFDHPDKTRDYVTVEVRQGRKVIFPRGQLWLGSPGGGWPDGSDGKKVRGAAIGLVAMAPGDTDRDYFDGYTSEQLEWASDNGEWLSIERERRFPE